MCNYLKGCHLKLFKKLDTTTGISEWIFQGQILLQSKAVLIITAESEKWASLGGNELYTERLNLLWVEVGVIQAWYQLDKSFMPLCPNTGHLT